MELFDVLKAKAGIPVEDAMAVLFAKRKKSKEKLMPFDNGITNFYDCKKGVTASAWKNQASAQNDAALTGATVTQDGALQVSGTSSSYGYFDAAFDGASSVCIYAVFKAALEGQINENRHIVGSCFGSVSSYTAGAWLTAAIDGYDAADTLGSDLWGMGCGSSITCEDYHVVTVNKQFHQGTYNEYKVSLYIDGVFIAETSTFYVGSGTKFGIGAVRDGDNAFAYNSSSMPVQIKMLAVGSEIHSAAQIAQNVAYLRQYYGLTATISGIPPLTFKAFGEYLTDYLISGNTIQNVGCGERTENIVPLSLTRYPYALTGVESEECFMTRLNNAAVYILPASPGMAYTIKIFVGGEVLSVLRAGFCSVSTPRERASVTQAQELLSSSNPCVTVVNSANLPYLALQISGAYVNNHGLTTTMIVEGSEVPASYVPYGYKLPVTCGGATNSIYIGNYPLNGVGNVVDDVSYSAQTLTRRINPETLEVLATPSTEAVTVPQIPTATGTNTLTVGTTVQPSNVSITGEIWTDTGA